MNTARPARTLVHHAMRQIESEYLELPGMTLTFAQARRLLSLDATTCSAVLTALMREGFLKRDANGIYVRVRWEARCVSCGRWRSYSSRNTSNGSTRAAFRAGT